MGEDEMEVGKVESRQSENKLCSRHNRICTDLAISPIILTGQLTPIILENRY